MIPLSPPPLKSRPAKSRGPDQVGFSGSERVSACGWVRRSLIVWIALGGLVSLLAKAVADEPAWTRYQRRERHMGTEFVVTVYASDALQAGRGLDAAFERISSLDAQLSNYKSDSELSRLSATSPHARPVPVGQDLWRVLQAAQQLSEASDGAFDITIGPLTKLWRRARRTHRRPDAERLREAREAVGYQQLVLNADLQAVQLLKPGMLLDPGGIAKGDALDEALAELARHGLSRALIDGGGDVLAGDPPPGESAWRIGIAGLTDRTPIDGQLELVNQAVATSGDLWQFVELDGVRYSHLIDPRTGEGLTRRLSVTVVAPTGRLADAWASAISVLGPEVGLARLARHPQLEVRFAYLEAGEVQVRQSPGFTRLMRSD